jgi:hypothetical protein
MLLDFFTTTFVAQGDISMEGNSIAALWWKITGRFHHIDLLIWIPYVFVIGWIANMKSEFVALWWFDSIAVGHLFGWLTWTTFSGVTNSLYSYTHALFRFDFVYAVPIGFFGILFGLLFAFVQIKLRNTFS